jgi:tetratricopeptide (TPR) repeat protein
MGVDPMINMNDFYAELDQLYEKSNYEAAEKLMVANLKTARDQKDVNSQLPILNEYMALLRSQNRHQEMLALIPEADAVIETLSIQHTAAAAATYINIAEGARSAMQYDIAERFYRKAASVYADLLSPTDPRIAVLHNNIAHLYLETRRAQKARAEAFAALNILKQVEDKDQAARELASTYINLGDASFALQETHEGTRWLEMGIASARRTGTMSDPRCLSALITLSETFLAGKNYDRAERYMAEALTIIKSQDPGSENEKTIRRNLNYIRDLKKRQDAYRDENLKGLDLCRAFYEEYGRPLIEEKYPMYRDRIAAGLIGEGSECFGFDDRYSTDHDFGPAFCLWLTDEDYREIGSMLADDYTKLPKTFRGFPTRNSRMETGQRVGVFSISDFIRRISGCEKAPKTFDEWWKVDETKLATLMGGKIFEDPLGLFTMLRSAFEYYPEEIRLIKLANSLHAAAQAGQYNLPRARRRGDIGMMYFTLSEFCEAACQVGYLINRRYMPYYKWRMRGIDSFTLLPELRVNLESIMKTNPADPAIDEKIEKLCSRITATLRHKKLTNSNDIYLETQSREVMRIAYTPVVPAAKKAESAGPTVYRFD